MSDTLSRTSVLPLKLKKAEVTRNRCISPRFVVPPSLVSRFLIRITLVPVGGLEVYLPTPQIAGGDSTQNYPPGTWDLITFWKVGWSWDGRESGKDLVPGSKSGGSKLANGLRWTMQNYCRSKMGDGARTSLQHALSGLSRSPMSGATATTALL